MGASQIKKPSVSRISPSVAASSSSHQQPGGYVDAGVDDDIQEVLPVKTEPSSSHHIESVHDQSGIVAQMEDENYVEEGYEYADGQYDAGAYGTMGDGTDIAKDIDSEINQRMFKEGSIWYCNDCEYKGSKSHVYEHVEAKHVTHGGYQCQFCSKILKTKGS